MKTIIIKMINKLMKKARKGMTLVEVLFATAIFSFVAITMFALFKLGQSYWGRGMAYNLIQNDMKKTSSLIEKYLKQAYDESVSIVNSGIPSRSSIFFVVQNEADSYDYLGFVATIDTILPDNTGYLYFLYLGQSKQPNLPFSIPNPITRSNINQINVNNIDQNNRKIILLSDNIASFIAIREENSKPIRITMNFIKKTIGENTVQSVGGTLFITPLNTFQSSNRSSNQ